MRDSVFSSRAVFIDAALLRDAGAEAAKAVRELSRSFRIVAVGGHAFISPSEVASFSRTNRLELYASWFVGSPPDLGFRGVLTPGPGSGLPRALKTILRAEVSSRIVVEPAEIEAVLAAARRRGKKVVFTNGVFDLLHAGHLRLLAEARRHGDMLVVGINSDDSTRAIKGPGRPVVPQFARAELLVGLRAVDWCVIFTQKDPKRLLSIVRPDVLVKGSDYPVSRIVGARLVSGYGGRIVRVPVLGGFSTTSTIGKIREARL